PRGQRFRKNLSLLKDGLQTVKALVQSRSAKLKRERTLTVVLAEIEEANARAERVYVPKPYPGRVTLFWCTDWCFRVFHDTRLGWSEVAGGGLEVHVVPGNHKTMWEMPNVDTVAEK